MTITIRIGDYFWQRREIPKCDSCKENSATKKIYCEDIGIRICDGCFELLKEQVVGVKNGKTKRPSYRGN